MNITNETHILMDGLRECTFDLVKLPYNHWGNDYLVFWDSGRFSSWYSSSTNRFTTIHDSTYNTRIAFKEKPIDKPWTHEDAIQHLRQSVRNASGIHMFKIYAVTLDGIYDSSLSFYSYAYLLTQKCTIAYTEHMVPAYKKAQG
jgi:hypothetical protein